MAENQQLVSTRMGLRAYDTAIGFRNLDERSAVVAEFKKTHTIGMAAVLAGAIKGKDIIKDARKLKQIAAEVLKINHWAFEDVLLELAELEMIRGIEKQGGEIVLFHENVPLFYDKMYERLGIRWHDLNPDELEVQFLTILDKLAFTPLPEQQLFEVIGADARATQKLQAVGEGAALVQSYLLHNGHKIVTSPLHAFENPNQIVDLFENYPSDKIQEAFKEIRSSPGFPILMDSAQPIIKDMVRLGLVPAPTVVGADQRERAFAIMLYGLNPEYLTTKKQVLDRALALIACVRCGEVSGGVTSIKMPDKLLSALMDPGRNYTIRGHSSTPRQYAPLIRLGMIEPVKTMSDRWGAHLIPMPHNLEAVQLARTLLQRQGDALPERGNEREAATLLYTGNEYLAPLETVALSKRKLPGMSNNELAEAWNLLKVGEL